MFAIVITSCNREDRATVELSSPTCSYLFVRPSAFIDAPCYTLALIIPTRWSFPFSLGRTHRSHPHLSVFSADAPKLLT